MNADDWHLSWDFEFLHHPELKEAADATLDEFHLRQGEVAEAELVQFDVLGIGDVAFLFVENMSCQSSGRFVRKTLVLAVPCAYQQFVHLLLVAVFWSRAHLLLSVLGGRGGSGGRGGRGGFRRFHSSTHLCSVLLERSQLTRMDCTWSVVALVWYMSISWATSLLHSVRFSLS